MYTKHEQYVNTATDGLVVLIEHNLKSMMPSIFIYEPVGLTDRKSVSLYDSRISSIESKGQNITQISFALPFEGYINLVEVKNNSQDIESRLTRLEDLLSSTLQQQKNLVSNSQWREMNTLLLQQIATLDSTLTTVSKNLNNLKLDVDSL